jgi:UDP-N-acetylmuramyl pentapeptide phosphotransferase/UDP-N-acetylglucosamine-1-phosphate transferase
MGWTFAGVSFVAVFAASLAATRLILELLRRRAILALPNERSSHATPTPTGGGIAVIAVVLASWYGLAPHPGMPRGIEYVMVGAAGLALLSWLDDLYDLSPLIRLATQLMAVILVFLRVPADGAYFGGLLPDMADRLLAGLVWLWFINLFNFMDGIDALAATESISIGLGIALVATLAGLVPGYGLLGLVTAAAALGFLWWNRPPAKIFLGDVGSIPLGFVFGWLLLELAAAGAGVAALILPLYYFADATVTLIKRALRGEKVWRAHREHFYHLGLRRGLSHGAVVVRVLAVNVALIALAAATARGWAIPALVAAVLLVTALLWHLRGNQTAQP